MGYHSDLWDGTRQLRASIQSRQSDLGACNPIVRENVLPLLGRYPDRIFNRQPLAVELAAWLCVLPGYLVIVFDYIAGFEPLVDALVDAPPALRTKIEHRMHPCLLGAAMLENHQFKLARDAAYVSGLLRHDALDVAKPLRLASSGLSGVLSPSRMIAAGRCSSTASTM